MPALKRSLWSPEEERMMALEVEIKAGTQVPSRKTCTEILKKYEGRGIFKNRTKIRRMISSIHRNMHRISHYLGLD